MKTENDELHDDSEYPFDGYDDRFEILSWLALVGAVILAVLVIATR